MSYAQKIRGGIARINAEAEHKYADYATRYANIAGGVQGLAVAEAIDADVTLEHLRCQMIDPSALTDAILARSLTPGQLATLLYGLARKCSEDDFGPVDGPLEGVADIAFQKQKEIDRFQEDWEIESRYREAA